MLRLPGEEGRAGQPRVPARPWRSPPPPSSTGWRGRQAVCLPTDQGAPRRAAHLMDRSVAGRPAPRQEVGSAHKREIWTSLTVRPSRVVMRRTTRIHRNAGPAAGPCAVPALDRTRVVDRHVRPARLLRRPVQPGDGRVRRPGLRCSRRHSGGAGHHARKVLSYGTGLFEAMTTSGVPVRLHDTLFVIVTYESATPPSLVMRCIDHDPT